MRRERERERLLLIETDRRLDLELRFRGGFGGIVVLRWFGGDLASAFAEDCARVLGFSSTMFMFRLQGV